MNVGRPPQLQLAHPYRPSSYIADHAGRMVVRCTAVDAQQPHPPGVYEAAHEVGMATPGDLAVIAHGEALDARSLRPALSAIRASHYGCGRVGAETLLDLILGRAHEERVVYLEPTLDVRDSCGGHSDGDTRSETTMGAGPVAPAATT